MYLPEQEVGEPLHAASSDKNVQWWTAAPRGRGHEMFFQSMLR